MPARVSPAQRFWYYVRINDESGCWEWTGGKNNRGYGLFKVDSKMVATHRFAYEMMVSDIPDGIFVCHKCDNPPCCNPAHLFLGTRSDNVQDCLSKGRFSAPKQYRIKATGKCFAGLHDWVPENIKTKANGALSCKLCLRIGARARYSKRVLALGRAVKPRPHTHKAGAVVATHSYTPDVSI